MLLKDSHWRKGIGREVGQDPLGWGVFPEHPLLGDEGP